MLAKATIATMATMALHMVMLAAPRPLLHFGVARLEQRLGPPRIAQGLDLVGDVVAPIGGDPLEHAQAAFHLRQPCRLAGPGLVGRELGHPLLVLEATLE